MADLEDRITALETSNADLTSRLSTAENTLKAIGDTVAKLDPNNVNTSDASAAIADIKTKTNDFYTRVFGDVLFPPSPTPE